MIAYASRTGTRRNLKRLRELGWRLMVSATGAHRHEGFPYAIDNGAWTAYQKGEPFDSEAFLKLLDSHAADADFIVIPDIVGAGLESLRFSEAWIPRLLTVGRPLLLAVQDGMFPGDVEDIVQGYRLGIFVGGTTEFKEQSLPTWGHFAKAVKCWLHVGRVNSRRRIRLCHACGVDSFDGTSATRYVVTADKLNAERLQRCLW